MLEQIKFKYKENTLEFRNLDQTRGQGKEKKIFSIRLGQINKSLIFVNYKDYSMDKLRLNENSTKYYFEYKGKYYSINKDLLLNNSIVTFTLS